MDNVMTKGFAELSATEMEEIDGGISWNDVGLYLAGAGGASVGAYAGAKIGGSVGWIGGPAGSMAGTIIGGAAGIIIYSLWD